MAETLENNPVKQAGQQGGESGAEGMAGKEGGAFVAPVGPMVLRGTSMRPALEPLDLLDVRDYGSGPIRVGDIVVARPPGYAGVVVHRVVGRSIAGWHTRGDSRRRADRWCLDRRQIQGRVAGRWRGGRYRSLARGRWAKPAVVLGLFRLRISTGVRSACQALRRMLDDRVPESWRPRPVLFRSESAARWHLMIGRRSAARWDPVGKRWVPGGILGLWIDPATLSPPEGGQRWPVAGGNAPAPAPT